MFRNIHKANKNIRSVQSDVYKSYFNIHKSETTKAKGNIKHVENNKIE